ncbi:glycosyltransferase [Persicobacter sp. CCB-QB2]|uniref:glycosyltransferase n=1 Tax=Persicobacter sp. CCB-QB2 TaxID=1561025 RepID=UPI0006A984A6|nr:glycosyltransferase [Persicobacter sp. CCB-QB2]
MSLFFSVVVPVYNRPQEIQEFLESVKNQDYRDFEVLVIEDGSSVDCKAIVERYEPHFQLQYFYKPNSGQGPSRNFGFERARGDYFLVFDSDVILPPNYLALVNAALAKEGLDAFGGPDAAHPDFDDLQKATTYAMTSLFTTGGIRGGKKADAKFQPRSFNMGLSRAVWEKTGGFQLERLSEDIDLSIRMRAAGFKVGLIPEAWVYHKRRTSLKQFFRQVFAFGHGRWILSALHPGQLKAIHFMPACFVLGLLFSFSTYFWWPEVFPFFLVCILMWYLAIFIDAGRHYRSVKVGALSMITSTVQLGGYGLGFIRGGFRKILGRKIY